MASFDIAFMKTRKWELGYVNDPDDKGRETMNGVTLAVFKQYYGKDKTVNDLKKITLDQEKTIARYYWNGIKGDSITDQKVANLLYDFVYNSGVKNAVKGLQTVLKVTVDGIIGQQTLGALNASKTVFTDLWNYRKNFYLGIVQRKPNQKKFLKGWLNRLEDFK